MVAFDQLLAEMSADRDDAGGGRDPPFLPLEDVLPRMSERAVVLGRVDRHHQRPAQPMGQGGGPVGAEPVVNVDDVHALGSGEFRDPAVVAVRRVPERAVRGAAGPVGRRERGGSLPHRAPRKSERHTGNGGERPGVRGEEGDPVTELR